MNLDTAIDKRANLFYNNEWFKPSFNDGNIWAADGHIIKIKHYEHPEHIKLEDCQQLFLRCQACEGKGQYHGKATPIKLFCHSCNGRGKIHIDLSIEQLTKITELMRVEKPFEAKRLKAKIMATAAPMSDERRREWREYNQAQNKLKAIVEHLQERPPVKLQQAVEKYNEPTDYIAALKNWDEKLNKLLGP